MAGLSDTYENSVLDAILGAGFTRDVTVYLALCTTAPTDAAVGAEPVGNAYARVAITNNATNFPAAASGQKKNGTVITFPEATGAWGTQTHFMVMNHANGVAASNIITWGALTIPRTIGSGETAQFAVNALTITAD